MLFQQQSSPGAPILLSLDDKDVIWQTILTYDPVDLQSGWSAHLETIDWDNCSLCSSFLLLLAIASLSHSLHPLRPMITFRIEYPDLVCQPLPFHLYFWNRLHNIRNRLSHTHDHERHHTWARKKGGWFFLSECIIDFDDRINMIYLLIIIGYIGLCPSFLSLIECVKICEVCIFL